MSCLLVNCASNWSSSVFLITLYIHVIFHLFAKFYIWFNFAWFIESIDKKSIALEDKMWRVLVQFVLIHWKWEMSTSIFKEWRRKTNSLLCGDLKYSGLMCNHASTPCTCRLPIESQLLAAVVHSWENRWSTYTRSHFNFNSHNSNERLTTRRKLEVSLWRTESPQTAFRSSTKRPPYNNLIIFFPALDPPTHTERARTHPVHKRKIFFLHRDVVKILYFPSVRVFFVPNINRSVVRGDPSSGASTPRRFHSCLFTSEQPINLPLISCIVFPDDSSSLRFCFHSLD